MESIKYIVRAIIILLLQVLLIDRIELFGLCQPYIYILPLILLPVRQPVWVDMLLGAALGGIIDVYSSTPGIHMSACVTLCYVRRWAIPHIVFAPERLKGELSAQTLGGPQMGQLTLLLILLHHTIVFVLAAWSWQAIGWTLITIVLSTAVTWLLMAPYLFMHPHHRKRE